MASEPNQERLLYHHTSISHKPVQFQMANLSRKQSAIAETYEISPYDDAPSNSSTTLDHDEIQHKAHRKNTITPAQMDNYAADSAPFAANKLSRWSHFTWLIITTVVSTLLVVAGRDHWVMPLKLQVSLTFSGANFPILEDLTSNLLLNHCLTQRETMRTPKTFPKKKY